MAKTKAEKNADIELQMAQLENQRKKLIQEQKQQERKDRTKRLCKRMGLFESMLPETITLTDEQFQVFLEKTVYTEHSRRILDGLTAQTSTLPVTNSAVTEETSSAAKDADGGIGIIIIDRFISCPIFSVPKKSYRDTPSVWRDRHCS